MKSNTNFLITTFVSVFALLLRANPVFSTTTPFDNSLHEENNGKRKLQLHTGGGGSIRRNHNTTSSTTFNNTAYYPTNLVIIQEYSDHNNNECQFELEQGGDDGNEVGYVCGAPEKQNPSKLPPPVSSSPTVAPTPQSTSKVTLYSMTPKSTTTSQNQDDLPPCKCCNKAAFCIQCDPRPRASVRCTDYQTTWAH